ncbi:hypothetical protein LTR66_004451 [Elasticomyces elasticus]|nr:hypothetical protein LTR66_004451 [Elasticomyces elasticus]
MTTRRVTLSFPLIVLGFLMLPIWLPLSITCFVVTICTRSLWTRYGPVSSKIERKPLSRFHAAKGVPLPGRERRAISNPPLSRRRPVRSPREGFDGSRAECGFFLLPWELREQIWDDLICPGEKLHIVQLKNRLAFLPRDLQDTLTIESAKRTMPEAEPGLLTLLKTSRRMYNEAIEQIYTKNIFYFTESNVVTSFVRTVIPQRLQIIRHVVIEVKHLMLEGGSTFAHVAFNKRIWTRMCKALAQMTGLRTLRILLRIGQITWKHSGWSGVDDTKWPKRILDPLMKLEARDSFVVEYPWPSEKFSTWPGASFEMRQIAS